jgi:exosome complex RNA-binding protein Rrp4
MMLQTINGNIVISTNGFFINCKNSDLKKVFKELFKLVPKHSKVKDMKSIITEKISSI